MLSRLLCLSNPSTAAVAFLWLVVAVLSCIVCSAEASPLVAAVDSAIIVGDNVTTAVPGNVTTPTPTHDKNETQPVRGEVWGILISAVGGVICVGMTATLLHMARKKKRAALAKKKSEEAGVMGK